MKFVIIGGGIAGLATAIALRKASHEVIVLEAKPEFTEVCMAAFQPSYLSSASGAIRIITARGAKLALTCP